MKRHVISVITMMLFLTLNVKSQVLIQNLIQDPGEFLIVQKGKEVHIDVTQQPSFNPWYGFEPYQFGMKRIYLVRYRVGYGQVPYYSSVFGFSTTKDDGDGKATIAMCVIALSINQVPYIYSAMKCTEEIEFKLLNSPNNGEDKSSTFGGG